MLPQSAHFSQMSSRTSRAFSSPYSKNYLELRNQRESERLLIDLLHVADQRFVVQKSVEIVFGRFGVQQVIDTDPIAMKSFVLHLIEQVVVS